MLPRDTAKRTPDLSRGVDLVVDFATVLEHVRMVEDRRAALTAPTPHSRR
jgi:hypothetical protein